MDIVQNFYDSLATDYDKLFYDWSSSVKEQAAMLDSLFASYGFDRSAKILDCACGIGTQAIGLAKLGYRVSASDISERELEEAAKRAQGISGISFMRADFRELSSVFRERFDIVMAMDNALPHMLTENDLKKAVKSISDRIAEGGIFVGSIRDYDAIIESKPQYSPPYIHKYEDGQIVSFQTWEWEGEGYRLTQYIIDDRKKLCTDKFVCKYRATTRAELTECFKACSFCELHWLFPEQTGFYQPIIIARK